MNLLVKTVTYACDNTRGIVKNNKYISNEAVTLKLTMLLHLHIYSIEKILSSQGRDKRPFLKEKVKELDKFIFSSFHPYKIICTLDKVPG